MRHLAGRSIGLDVCSLGELVTAERAGFPAQRLTLHGAGKTEQELRAACDGRVGYIVVDGIEELEALARLSRGASRVQIILRLNVGIEAQTHAFVRTGGDDTKFGIHERDETAAIAILSANPQLRFAGLHAHLGSQIRQPPAYVENAASLLDAAERFERAGFRVERIVIGGGFGVKTQPQEDDSLDVVATVREVEAYVLDRVRERNLSVTRLGVEPGRAIVALAGTTLYRVACGQASIAANLRRRRRRHRRESSSCALRRSSSRDPGRIRTRRRGGDDALRALVRERRARNRPVAAQRRRGDLLAMCATGAYTYSMAGNYNRFPRPAVVGIAEGTHRLLARRESLEDVLRRDAVGNASGEAGTAF